MQNALTDQRYWDEIWEANGGARSVPRLEHGPITDFLTAALAERLGPGRRFLEVGAGGSAWPAYVAATLRAEAWGLDFSAVGLKMAARASARDAPPLHLVEGDLFDRTRLPNGAFQVVYSGGLVEHFPLPEPLMNRLAELLARGGVVITLVPNLAGLNGWLQRLVDVETWRRHVVFTPSTLDEAHQTGGLVPLERARYLGSLDPLAVNYSRALAPLPSPLRRGLLFSLAKVRWAGIAWGARTTPHTGRLLAPMIGGIYRRSDDPTFAAGN